MGRAVKLGGARIEERRSGKTDGERGRENGGESGENKPAESKMPFP